MSSRPASSETIHYSQLKPAQPEEAFYQEWNTYLRELPRLLTEEREGQFVLILGDVIIDYFPTFAAAVTLGRQRFGRQRILVQQVREQEPVLRLKWVG